MTTKPTPSETPETDVELTKPCNCGAAHVHTSFAKRLEKSRNALRAQVAELTRERDAATEMERQRWQNVHADFMESLKKNAALTREVEQLREVIKQARGWIQSDLNSEDGFLCVRAELQRRVQVLTDAAMSARNEKETE